MKASGVEGVTKEIIKFPNLHETSPTWSSALESSLVIGTELMGDWFDPTVSTATWGKASVWSSTNEIMSWANEKIYLRISKNTSIKLNLSIHIIQFGTSVYCPNCWKVVLEENLWHDTLDVHLFSVNNLFSVNFGKRLKWFPHITGVVQGCSMTLFDMVIGKDRTVSSIWHPLVDSAVQCWQMIWGCCLRPTNGYISILIFSTTSRPRPWQWI